MKRTFPLFVFIAVLILSSISVTEAAKPSFGIKAGVSLYTISVTSDPADMGIKPGLTVGAALEVPLFPNLDDDAMVRPYMSCDAFYTMKGVTISNPGSSGNHNFGDDTKLNLAEISFGSFLGIKTNTDPVFFVAAGFELGFALYSKANFEEGSSDVYLNIMDDTNTPELSYAFELGAEIPLYGKTWTTSLRGTYGHTSIYDIWSSTANTMGIQCLIGLKY